MTIYDMPCVVSFAISWREMEVENYALGLGASLFVSQFCSVLSGAGAKDDDGIIKHRYVGVLLRYVRFYEPVVWMGRHIGTRKI